MTKTQHCLRALAALWLDHPRTVPESKLFSGATGCEKTMSRWYRELKICGAALGFNLTVYKAPQIHDKMVGIEWIKKGVS